MNLVKTRNGVFETNSSSTHSLTLSPNFENMITSPVSDLEIKQGYIVVQPGEFGWEEQDHWEVHEKISYLYVDAMYSAQGDVSIDPNDEYYRNSNIHLKMIVDAVKEYTGFGVFFEKQEDKYNPFGYIDHQSLGICGDVWDEGTNGVVRFIFSNDSYFKTDNDNH